MDILCSIFVPFFNLDGELFGRFGNGAKGFRIYRDFCAIFFDGCVLFEFGENCGQIDWDNAPAETDVVFRINQDIDQFGKGCFYF